MSNFFANLFIGFIRFAFSLVKGIYAIAAHIVLITSWIVIVMAPGYFVLLDMKNENPLFILYLFGALAWPFIWLAIIHSVVRIKRGYACDESYSILTQNNDAPDESLYGSNSLIFGNQALINAEVPYTTEHLAKYGSLN